MQQTTKIELWNGEEILIEPSGAAQLFRDGALVVTANFATTSAAQRWADAILERAAKSSPRAMCLYCET